MATTTTEITSTPRRSTRRVSRGKQAEEAPSAALPTLFAEEEAAASPGGGEEEVRTAARLAERLEARIGRLVEAISEERIAEANLVQVATALRTLIDKAQALRRASSPTAEEIAEQMTQMQRQVAEVIKRHVHDGETRERIAADLERLAAGAAGADPVSGGVVGGGGEAQPARGGTGLAGVAGGPLPGGGGPADGGASCAGVGVV